MNDLVKQLRDDFDKNGVENFEVNDVAYLFNCIEELQDQLHYAEGCCELAMKHRDEAERKLNKILELVEEGLNEL